MKARWQLRNDCDGLIITLCVLRISTKFTLLNFAINLPSQLFLGNVESPTILIVTRTIIN